MSYVLWASSFTCHYSCFHISSLVYSHDTFLEIKLSALSATGEYSTRHLLSHHLCFESSSSLYASPSKILALLVQEIWKATSSSRSWFKLPYYSSAVQGNSFKWLNSSVWQLLVSSNWVKAKIILSCFGETSFLIFHSQLRILFPNPAFYTKYFEMKLRKIRTIPKNIEDLRGKNINPSQM